MKIVRLNVENVMRLKAVEIAPDGATIMIRGNNGQGKTSVLTAISMALGGKDQQPPEPIRRGAEKAVVVVDLGDIVVERRWTSNDNSTLVVKSKEGARYPSPQAMLDKLVGKLSFDPLAFTRLEPKKQAETMRSLVGLDFGDVDRQRQTAFDQRTEANRDLKAIEARLSVMPDVEAPDEPVSMASVIEEQKLALAAKDANDAVRRRHAGLRDRYREKTKELKDTKAMRLEAEAMVEKLQRDENQLVKDLSDLTRDGNELGREVDGLKDPDLDAMAAKLAQVETTNNRVRQRRERAAEAKKLKEKQNEVTKLTAKISMLDGQKSEMLANTKFPVEGLGFGDAGVTFNGLPLEQASNAEQLRVSVAMALAMNPKLKVLLIRDGSLLDKNSLHLISEMANASGAQVWIEAVEDDGQPGSVVIEDGMVK